MNTKTITLALNGIIIILLSITLYQFYQQKKALEYIEMSLTNIERDVKNISDESNETKNNVEEIKDEVDAIKQAVVLMNY